MRVSSVTDLPQETAADTVAVGVFDGEAIAHDTSGGELQALLESGEARSEARHMAVAHADGKRWIVVGLGARERFDGERARIVAAGVLGRARDLGARALCWEVPHKVDDAIAGGLVEGTLLAAYRFEAFKTPAADRPADVEELVVSAHHDLSEPVAVAVVVAEAVNAARELQNTPANVMTPTALGEHARSMAGAVEGVTVEVEGRSGLEERDMRLFAAVAQGSYEEPALITLRYEGPDATGPVLGLVGKAVTFDTGGISIKPAAKMSDMKFDMSGGAAVIEAVRAIARLRLPIRLVAVVGATENMPSGRSMRPGDIVQAKNGLHVEINNTDAEGRLVLGDCLTYAIEQGAERLVDIATLTGGIIVALGGAHAGLFADDDGWAGELEAAGRASGELVWRMPLHEDYADAIKGRYGDLDNAPEERKATSITAAEFLKRFSGDVPWAHLDIAGVAWNRGRAYAPTGGTGFGVRLLVELARAGAGAAATPG